MVSDSDGDTAGRVTIADLGLRSSGNRVCGRLDEILEAYGESDWSSRDRARFARRCTKQVDDAIKAHMESSNSSSWKEGERATWLRPIFFDNPDARWKTGLSSEETEARWWHINVGFVGGRKSAYSKKGASRDNDAAGTTQATDGVRVKSKKASKKHSVKQEKSGGSSLGQPEPPTTTHRYFVYRHGKDGSLPIQAIGHPFSIPADKTTDFTYLHERLKTIPQLFLKAVAEFTVFAKTTRHETFRWITSDDDLADVMSGNVANTVNACDEDVSFATVPVTIDTEEAMFNLQDTILSVHESRRRSRTSQLVIRSTPAAAIQNSIEGRHSVKTETAPVNNFDRDKTSNCHPDGVDVRKRHRDERSPSLQDGDVDADLLIAGLSSGPMGSPNGPNETVSRDSTQYPAGKKPRTEGLFEPTTQSGETGGDVEMGSSDTATAISNAVKHNAHSTGGLLDEQHERNDNDDLIERHERNDNDDLINPIDNAPLDTDMFPLDTVNVDGNATTVEHNAQSISGVLEETRQYDDQNDPTGPTDTVPPNGPEATAVKSTPEPTTLQLPLPFSFQPINRIDANAQITPMTRNRSDPGVSSTSSKTAGIDTWTYADVDSRFASEAPKWSKGMEDMFDLTKASSDNIDSSNTNSSKQAERALSHPLEPYANPIESTEPSTTNDLSGKASTATITDTNDQVDLTRDETPIDLTMDDTPMDETDGDNQIKPSNPSPRSNTSPPDDEHADIVGDLMGQIAPCDNRDDDDDKEMDEKTLAARQETRRIQQATEQWLRNVTSELPVVTRLVDTEVNEYCSWRGCEVKSWDPCRPTSFLGCKEIDEYQLLALFWMWRHEGSIHDLCEGRIGGVMASEMGLGKTRTFITLFLLNWLYQVLMNAIESERQAIVSPSQPGPHRPPTHLPENAPEGAQCQWSAKLKFRCPCEPGALQPKPAPSGLTVVVAPAAVLGEWTREFGQVVDFEALTQLGMDDIIVAVRHGKSVEFMREYKFVRDWDAFSSALPYHHANMDDWLRANPWCANREALICRYMRRVDGDTVELPPKPPLVEPPHGLSNVLLLATPLTVDTIWRRCYSTLRPGWNILSVPCRTDTCRSCGICNSSERGKVASRDLRGPIKHKEPGADPTIEHHLRIARIVCDEVHGYAHGNKFIKGIEGLQCANMVATGAQLAIWGCTGTPLMPQLTLLMPLWDMHPVKRKSHYLSVLPDIETSFVQVCRGSQLATGSMAELIQSCHRDGVLKRDWKAENHRNLDTQRRLLSQLYEKRVVKRVRNWMNDCMIRMCCSTKWGDRVLRPLPALDSRETLLNFSPRSEAIVHGAIRTYTRLARTVADAQKEREERTQLNPDRTDRKLTMGQRRLSIILTIPALHDQLGDDMSQVRVEDMKTNGWISNPEQSMFKDLVKPMYETSPKLQELIRLIRELPIQHRDVETPKGTERIQYRDHVVVAVNEPALIVATTLVLRHYLSDILKPEEIAMYYGNNDRDSVYNRFEFRPSKGKDYYDGPNCSVLVLSTKSGSAGLTLVSAATIIKLDVDPNPRNVVQLHGRVFRYGQSRECTIIQLVSNCQGIEKKMIANRGKIIAVSEYILGLKIAQDDADGTTNPSAILDASTANPS